jgi:hypothetical protein
MTKFSPSERQRLIVLLIVGILYALVVSYADLQRSDVKVIDVDSLNVKEVYKRV